jgi:hypothetical protein
MTTPELCPICIENDVTCITECSHSYCITCLCKIKKCALCRKHLIRHQLCKEIIGKIRVRVLSKPEESYLNYLLTYLHAPREDINFSFTTLNLMAGMQGLAYIN